MLGPKPTGNQQLDALPQQLVAAITKDLFGLRVEQHDRSFRVADQLRIGRAFHHGLESPLTPDATRKVLLRSQWHQLIVLVFVMRLGASRRSASKASALTASSSAAPQPSAEWPRPLPFRLRDRLDDSFRDMVQMAPSFGAPVRLASGTKVAVVGRPPVWSSQVTVETSAARPAAASTTTARNDCTAEGHPEWLVSRSAPTVDGQQQHVGPLSRQRRSRAGRRCARATRAQFQRVQIVQHQQIADQRLIEPAVKHPVARRRPAIRN